VGPGCQPAFLIGFNSKTLIYLKINPEKYLKIESSYF
jgi:hypothetical protein